MLRLNSEKLKGAEGEACNGWGMLRQFQKYRQARTKISSTTKRESQTEKHIARDRDIERTIQSQRKKDDTEKC